MSKTTKWFETSYISEIKENLGYQPDSLDLTVMNNPNTVGKVLLFGALANLSLKLYNLSIEKNGLLFIQRHVMNNQLLPDKVNFIENNEIGSIKFKKGLLQHKLIITNTSGKKIVFKCHRVIARVPWHKENLLQIQSMYE